MLSRSTSPAAAPIRFSCDCAFYLADYLRFDRMEALAWTVTTLRDRVRGGWKCAEEINNADAARAMTCVLLKGKIAQLEGAPV